MRVTELSLTLLLLLLVSPRHADGYALSMDSDEATYHLEKRDGSILLDTGEDDPSISTTETTTDNSPTSTSETTTDGSTDEANNSQSTTVSTTPETTTQSESTSPSTSTTLTTTLESTTISPASTSRPPPPGLSLLEDTHDELDKLTDTLDDFNILASSTRAPSPAASAPAGGRGGHPVGWWKPGTQTRPLEEIVNFCNTESTAEYSCSSLYDQLKNIEDLMDDLNANVDGWTQSKQDDLKRERQNLDGSYLEARTYQNAFSDSVHMDLFKAQISQVQEDVRSATESVEAKISDLTEDSGSVILVAVIGSIGGLMVVALISVMVYGAVKKGKTKKKLASAPYNKLQGENIPVDGFLSDGPGSRQGSRMDPYSRPVPSSVQSDPYAAPYGHRSESNYRGPTVTRPGQGLSRTHF